MDEFGETCESGESLQADSFEVDSFPSMDDEGLSSFEIASIEDPNFGETTQESFPDMDESLAGSLEQIDDYNSVTEGVQDEFPDMQDELDVPAPEEGDYNGNDEILLTFQEEQIDVPGEPQIEFVEEGDLQPEPESGSFDGLSEEGDMPAPVGFESETLEEVEATNDGIATIDYVEPQLYDDENVVEETVDDSWAVESQDGVDVPVEDVASDESTIDAIGAEDEINIDDEYDFDNLQPELEQLTPETEALNNMNEYMVAHDYGQWDYAEYSKDPEWQALNDALIAAESENANEDTAEGAVDSLALEDARPADEETQTSAEPTDLNNVYDAQINEIESMGDDSGIEASGDDNNGDMPIETEHIYPNDIDASVAEEPTSIADTGFEEGSIEGSQVFESPESDGDHIDSVEEIADHAEEIDSSANELDISNEDSALDSDPVAMPEETQGDRQYDDFERQINEVQPGFYETGQFYNQGVNEFGYEGTCGPTSQANALNQLFGTNEYTENRILGTAIDNGLCQTMGSPESLGGTTTEQFMELYERVREESGYSFETELFEYGDALSAEQVAERIESGDVVNVAVDSCALWDQPREYVNDLGVREDDFYSDHWITVSGVQRDANGAIEGFNIIDSGGGVDYVSADKYENMCFGTADHNVLDPTCIVVSKANEGYEPRANSANERLVYSDADLSRVSMDELNSLSESGLNPEEVRDRLAELFARGDESPESAGERGPYVKTIR